MLEDETGFRVHTIDGELTAVLVFEGDSLRASPYGVVR